jgi:hypothetical protein
MDLGNNNKGAPMSDAPNAPSVPLKPDAAAVHKAIEIYMNCAYAGAEPHVTVRSMLATLRGFAGDFFKAPTFVKDDPKAPRKYTLRLGNRFYPHMKLVYELGPDGRTFLFRADAHDAHCCPPAGTPEHDAFRSLMTANPEIVTAIEDAWAAANVPTFKTFLKLDLAKRRERAAGGGATAAAAAPQGPAASTP